MLLRRHLGLFGGGKREVKKIPEGFQKAKGENWGLTKGRLNKNLKSHNHDEIFDRDVSEGLVEWERH